MRPQFLLQSLGAAANRRLQGTRGSSGFLLCERFLRAPLNRVTLGVGGRMYLKDQELCSVP